MALIIALLIPTAAFAKGECTEDRQKFCKDVIKAKGDVGACLTQHEAELSETCKAAREARAKAGAGKTTSPQEATKPAPAAPQ